MKKNRGLVMNTLDMYKIAENEKIDVLNYKWTNAY